MARVVIAPTNAVSNPLWAKDYLNREHIIGPFRVDSTQFPRDDNVTVTVDTGGAAAGATSVPVTALSGPIFIGTYLQFNNGMYAHVTVAPITGDTALTVDPLDFAIPAGAVAVYHGTGRVYVRNGTLLGRTIAERDAGTGFGPAADTDIAPLGEVFPLVHDIDDAIQNPDATCYRPQSMIDEAHYPGYASLSTALKAFLRANYRMMRGAD